MKGLKENIPDVNTDFSVGTDFSANLGEIINLALLNKIGKKPTTPYRSTQDEFEPGYNPMTGKTDLNISTLAKKVRETKFTKKYDDNPALKGGQKDLPDALQKGIINKSQNEHHLKNNPDAKYVATAAPNGWFDVWEGEPFSEFSGDGVLVGKFKTMKDARDYANTKNAEQGKLEEYEVDMSGFEYSDQAKTALEKIKNARTARYQYNQPKKSDPTIAQRGGHDKVYKDYLKEDSNKIAALEKKRARLMADMEQEAEPEGGPIADKYGAELDRIDKALEKLKGSKKQYKVLSTAELDKLARVKR